MWRAQATTLRALGHTVVVPDQRGFGGTPLGAEPPSLDVVADDLAALLDARGLARAVLVGCSMGGYVALAFLRRHPHRVRALALLAARASADTARAAAERARFADLMLDDALRGQVIATTTPYLLGATTRAANPRLAERVTAAASDAAPEAVAWAQRAVAARRDALGLLRAADVPTLVVAGAEDELVSARESAATAAAARGRLVTLPAVGHLQPLEAPRAVTGLITSLLADAAVNRPEEAPC
jgi:pimeloyl-ACP methyl ester carboxylesterase